LVLEGRDLKALVAKAHRNMVHIYFFKNFWNLRCSSVVERLASTCKALGSIPAMGKKKFKMYCVFALHLTKNYIVAARCRAMAGGW
jgi:hypothetical protein